MGQAAMNFPIVSLPDIDYVNVDFMDLLDLSPLSQAAVDLVDLII